MSASTDRPSAALDGIRVLDLTSVVFGPYATQTLGDYGADILKIEPPTGDTTRPIVPKRNQIGSLFLNANRNKRSLCIDLKSNDGRALFDALVENADVVVHSMRPKAAERLGLTYDRLNAINGRIIVCAAWGFGSDGPYADRAAYDDIIQAMSGIAMLQDLGSPPAYPKMILADKVSGLVAANAITSALFFRERTGEGQFVEVPMFETMVSFVLLEHLDGNTYEPPLSDMGYRRLFARNRRPYRTADGYIAVMPYSKAQWQKFWIACGCAAKADDPRLEDGRRSDEIENLYDELADMLTTRTTAEWLTLLEAAGIAAAPVNTLEDLLRDPHLAATGFIQQQTHPTEGDIRFTAPPVRMSKSPLAVHRHAPLLGEHTDEILREVGNLAPDTIADARAKGVIK